MIHDERAATRAANVLLRTLAGVAEACYVAVLAVAIPVAALRLGEALGADAFSWDENSHPMEVSAALNLMLMGLALAVVVLVAVYAVVRALRGRLSAIRWFTLGGAVGAVVMGGLLAVSLELAPPYQSPQHRAGRGRP
ncbi:MAG: hypothetical protein ACT4OV_00035 [Microthrixaceae bacterium]